MLESFPSPTVLAHRGASAYAPENTLAAFELALAQGADGIELDVKLSADGHVVVMHDATVDRTTEGHGRVKAFTLSNLRALSAGRFYSDKFSGEKIPTLEEVFEAMGKRTLINIELTNYTSPYDHLVETVCMLVKKFEMEKRVMFSSFFALNLSRARSYMPEIPRGLLAFKGALGVWARSFGFAFGTYDALHPHLADTTHRQVQRVHRLNRRVHAWTVNRAEDMRRLFDWGVDAIFTDDPQLAVKVRGNPAEDENRSI